MTPIGRGGVRVRDTLLAFPPVVVVAAVGVVTGNVAVVVVLVVVVTVVVAPGVVLVVVVPEVDGAVVDGAVVVVEAVSVVSVVPVVVLVAEPLPDSPLTPTTLPNWHRTNAQSRVRCIGLLRYRWGEIKWLKPTRDGATRQHGPYLSTVQCEASFVTADLLGFQERSGIRRCRRRMWR